LQDTQTQEGPLIMSEKTEQRKYHMNIRRKPSDPSYFRHPCFDFFWNTCHVDYSFSNLF